MVRSLVAVCAIIFTLIGCEGLSTLSNTNVPIMNLDTPLTEAEIETFIGAPYPESVTDLHAIGYAALDTMIAVRFDFPADDLLPYLQRIGITNSLEMGNSPFLSTNPPYLEVSDWWQVVVYQDTSGTPHQGLREQVNGKHYSILIMNPNAAIVTVYMTVHNT